MTSGLGMMFGMGVRARNSLYSAGLLRSRRLHGPVISVGNISAGGTGKTPFVLLLGEMLKRRGIDFDILSRGYRRHSSGVLVVDARGSARDFGDEPLLMARRLSVPVIVGESRFEAGHVAERKFGPRLHLLDDGFQHRQLHRDFDIVLLTPEDLRDRLIPDGRLREPLTGLDRADAVVIPHDFELDPALARGKLVWRTRRGICVRDVPARPVAFCGIARPDRFFSQLRAAGIDYAAEMRFRDHHGYRAAEIAKLRTLAEGHHAGGFVTTEKDAINLGPLSDQLRPLAIASVSLELEDAGTALDTLLRIVDERHRARS
jgi:tetraacyldisaccharide 4'-kinase